MTLPTATLQQEQNPFQCPRKRPVLHLERCLPLSLVDRMAGACEARDIPKAEKQEAP